VPGGFGVRGVEGKICAAKFAREKPNSLPWRLSGHAGRHHPVARHVAEGLTATSLARIRARAPSGDRGRWWRTLMAPSRYDAESDLGTMRLGKVECRARALAHDL
jgi:CTP synthase